MQNGKMLLNRIIILLLLVLAIAGCTGLSPRPVVVTERVVEKIVPPPLTCPRARIDPLVLRSYEFKVLPALHTLGVTEEFINQLYEQDSRADFRYLIGHLQNSWWSVSPGDYQNLDMNDVDKLRALKQATELAKSLESCIAEYNQSLQTSDNPAN